MLRGGPQHLPSVAIRDDEPGFARQNVERKFRQHGEKQPVREVAVLGPFVVRAEILEARFDLDDPDRAIGRKRYNVRAPTVRQRHLRERRQSVGGEQAHHAATNLARNLGLRASHARRGNRGGLQSVIYRVVLTRHGSAMGN